MRLQQDIERDAIILGGAPTLNNKLATFRRVSIIDGRSQRQIMAAPSLVHH
jgi:hypothetical protein